MVFVRFWSPIYFDYLRFGQLSEPRKVSLLATVFMRFRRPNLMVQEQETHHKGKAKGEWSQEIFRKIPLAICKVNKGKSGKEKQGRKSPTRTRAASFSGYTLFTEEFFSHKKEKHKGKEKEK